MREILVVALTIALLGGLAPGWSPRDPGGHGGGGMALAGIPGGSGGGGMALAGPPGESGG